MNIHIDTNAKPPEGWTETEKMLAVVVFWKRWDPSFRRCIVNMQIAKGDMFDTADGVIESILKALEVIDKDRLVKELEGAGLIKLKQKDDSHETNSDK